MNFFFCNVLWKLENKKELSHSGNILIWKVKGFWKIKISTQVFHYRKIIKSMNFFLQCVWKFANKKELSHSVNIIIWKVKMFLKNK
jgi:hypothetical protein